MRERKSQVSSTRPFTPESVSHLMFPVKHRAHSTAFYKSVRKHLVGNAALSAMAIAVAFWENDVYHSTRDLGSVLTLSLRSLLILITILQLCILAQTHKLLAKEASTISILPTSRFWTLLEFVITTPASIPYCEMEIEVTQMGQKMKIDLDDILVPIVCLRIVHILKLFEKLTFFSSPRGIFYTSLHGVSTVTRFTMRLYFHLHLLPIFACFTVLNVCISGFLLRVFERSIPDADSMGYITNGFWLIELSERTIGYGDLVPKTHIGRLIIIICIVVGISNLSLAMKWIIDNAELSQDEVILITTLIAQKQSPCSLRRSAAILIQRKWRLFAKRKAGMQRFLELMQFLSHSSRFKFDRYNWKTKSELPFKYELTKFDNSSRTELKSLLATLREAKECLITVLPNSDKSHINVQAAAITICSKDREKTAEICEKRKGTKCTSWFSVSL